MKKVLLILLAVLACCTFTYSQDVNSKKNKSSKTVSKKPTPKPKKQVTSKKNAALTDTITDDRNGNKYELLKIGESYWMTENLRWKSHSNIIYEDNLENLKKYGRMYTIEESKIACPTGSHLPTAQEWDSLALAVDPKKNGDAGDKLIKKQGFAAVLGGYRNAKGKYVGIENETTYWSADGNIQFNGDVQGATMTVNTTLENKELKCAYYIRCVKNK